MNGRKRRSHERGAATAAKLNGYPEVFEASSTGVEVELAMGEGADVSPRHIVATAHRIAAHLEELIADVPGTDLWTVLVIPSMSTMTATVRIVLPVSSPTLKRDKQIALEAMTRAGKAISLWPTGNGG